MDAILLVPSLPEFLTVKGSGKARIPWSWMRDKNIHPGSAVRVQIDDSELLCSIWPHYMDDLSKCIVQQDDMLSLGSQSGNKFPSLKEGQTVQIFPEKSSEAKLVSCTLLDNDGNASSDHASIGPDLARRSLLYQYVERNGHVKFGVGGKIACLKIDSVSPEGVGRIVPSTCFKIKRQTRVEEPLPSMPVNPQASCASASVVLLRQMLSVPLRKEEEMEALGVECPRGILLHGPPGVGKTSIVYDVAEEFHAHVTRVTASDVFSSLAGETERNMRRAFAEADKIGTALCCPSILLIEDLDTLCPKRQGRSGLPARSVAQLLTLMDGVSTVSSKKVIVATTSRPDAVDPALRRGGRFDREVAILPPTSEQRYQLLIDRARSLPLSDDVDFRHISKLSAGFVAADISSLCSKAVMVALHNCETFAKIHHDHFVQALLSVSASSQREQRTEISRVEWDDIGGLDDVKQQLQQAIEWPLTHGETFERLGLKPPRGVLLHGPPGCCKTTLVKAVVTASNASFHALSGAQIYSPFVGSAEKMIRDTFQKARRALPAIIFIDEVDAIVGKRSETDNTGVQERVLSTLLNEMDGVELANGIVVIGATNRLDMLDEAILRPGRFDEKVFIPLPDRKAREEILTIHTRGMPLAADVDLSSLAKQEGLSGAELENLCREAGLSALRESLQSNDHVAKSVVVAMDHFRVHGGGGVIDGS